MLKQALSWLVWPLLVGGGLLAVHLAVGAGVTPAAALVTLQIVCVALIVPLERWMPEHEGWNVTRNDVRTDALHTLVSGIIISGALRAGVFAVAPSFGVWPSSLPVVVQLLLALFVADFGSYATHILTHRVALLWPIHAVHHSAHRLYWLNAYRMHPFDTSSTVIVSLLPLALLGVPIPVLALFDAFAIVHLMLQHSNLRLRLGPLDHVFASAEFHRWHHSMRRDEGEHNYASFLSLWDHICGTFRMPARRHPPEVVGLYDDARLPEGWLGQLRHPLAVWSANRSSERASS